MSGLIQEFLLSLPLIIVFLSIFMDEPEWIAKLKEGFETLNQLPDFIFTFSFAAIVGSSFGMKGNRL